MLSQGHRVTLSGIGGDEAMGGGVPTPSPELQNLLARVRFFALAHQLKAWAVKVRKPRMSLLGEAALGFFTLSPAGLGVPKDLCPAPWFHPDFIRRNHAALCGYPFRVKLFGPLPSFQENVVALNVLRRLLALWPLQPKLLREVRFPYLDRDLLEFMYAIPRGQIVGVGRRRYLMKRALAGIIPDELLNRRRKAFVPPASPKDSSTEWPSLVEIGPHIVSSSVGLVDPNRFSEALHKARSNEEIPIGILRRTLTLESWLRYLTVQRVLTNSISTKGQAYSLPLEAEETPSAHAAQKFS
jgi:asparagine synthase (glutamine-hydrolysing)